MENTNFTNEEKLSLLLDGELDNIDTSDLFFNLSQNLDLQEEFLDLIKLKSMIKNSNVAPPEKYKKAVYAGIGLSGSGLGYFFSNTGIITSVLAIITSKISLAILFLIGGAFITYNFNNEINQLIGFDNKENSNILTLQRDFDELDNKDVLNTPIIEMNLVSSISKEYKAFDSKSLNSATKSISSNISNLDVSSDNSNKSYINQVNTNQSYTNYYKNYENKNEIFQNEMNFSSINNFGDEIYPNYDLLNTYLTPNNDLFQLQARGLQLASLQKAQINTQENPIMNNVAVAIMYSVNDNLQIGVEFGQEFFSQDVSINMSGQLQDFTDRVLSNWGGIRAAYRIHEISVFNITPVPTAMIGIANNGIIGRFAFNFNYDINDKFALFLGPEYTRLFYSNGGINGISDKLGINYGLSLKF